MMRLTILHLLKPLLLFLLLLLPVISLVSSQTTDEQFGGSCVDAHNALRQKHHDTNDLTRSTELQSLAKEYASMLQGTDVTEVIHPVRPLPLKRKRRAVDEGIDDSIHLELWEGYIEYPGATDPWLEFKNTRRSAEEQMGRSIHKMCCSSRPHCPKEFFHGLEFPPSASGITKDMYNEEEKYYDYNEGKSKTIYSHINHFAKIVWKNTTLAGCAQSGVSKENCVFTVVLYQREGAVGDEANFMKNIGTKIDETDYSFATRIVLIVFIVCIVLALLLLLYCCRHKIDDKYQATKISIDVLKADEPESANQPL